MTTGAGVGTSPSGSTGAGNAADAMARTQQSMQQALAQSNQQRQEAEASQRAQEYRQAVQAATARGTIAASRSLENMSIEDLIELASSMAREMDEEIRGSVTEIKSARDQANALNSANNAISQWQAGHPAPTGSAAPATMDLRAETCVVDGTTMYVQDALDRGFNIDTQGIRRRFEAERRAAGATASGGEFEAALEMEFNRARDAAGCPRNGENSSDTHGVRASNVATVTNGISSFLNTVNSGAEIRTMNLQKAVSRRSEFLQTISQIITSKNDTSKSIVGNIGR